MGATGNTGKKITEATTPTPFEDFVDELAGAYEAM